MDSVSTTLVYGFLDSGKTSYIQDCIYSGYFHRHGTTLILAFEEGEIEYDSDRLRDYRTEVLYFDDTETSGEFCSRAVERFHPDRVYIEMNIMKEGLREQLPSFLDVVFTVTLLDGATLPLYYNNLRQHLQNMIAASDMTIFNRCPAKEELKQYSVPFRLMNSRCDFIRQSAMGYSEKAFPRYLPFDPEASLLEIPDDFYAAWHLDTQDEPEKYAGRTVSFDAQYRGRDDVPEGFVFLGRSVMTCCIMDIQFLGFDCAAEGTESLRFREGDWFHVEAEAFLRTNRYGVKYVALKPHALTPIAPPAQSIIGL